MAVTDEMKEKERRVRNFLRAKHLKALLLKRQANFCWMTFPLEKWEEAFHLLENLQAAKVIP